MDNRLPYEGEIDLRFVEQFVAVTDATIKIIQKVLKKKEESLISRWEMYLRVRKYLPTDSCYMDFKSIPEEISWYDDFYLAKGEIMELDEDFIQGASEKYKLTPEQGDSLREEILQSGYSSFENDW